MLFRFLLLLSVLLSAVWPPCRAEIIETDVLVFGGTAGGVSAACTAARFGKKVVLTEFGKHIGGLTSGGLGWTDIGNKTAIGGFSRDFYKRLGKHYGKAESWTFEPSVAERELRALLEEFRVPVHFEQRLAGVKKQGARIIEIAMEDGNIFRARMFIDCTYEGDLMARAGVSYMLGREANAQFGETLNGIREKTPSHQFLTSVDPYVKPGNPDSGLLPFILPYPLGAAGAADQSVQAYNFRLCLTNRPENLKPIIPPQNYDPRRYELLGRYIENLVKTGQKVTLRNFLKIDMVTPDKTDINNNGGFSTDYIGMSHSYPEATYAKRAQIWQEHLDYIQGFLIYLTTEPRVPESIRADLQTWGLCRDEFQDTGGWPHAMYVREARRLIGDYVMTENVCRGIETPTDAVGLGAYNMDSHNCRRIVRDGVAHNEGDVQVAVKPYPVSYRSIVPKESECENLFVPICLSATHIAYGSIRMEPVFMLLAQSSATAASLAIDQRVPVQKIDYARLQQQLLKDGQVLEWNGKVDGSGNPTADGRPAPAMEGLLFDDIDAEKMGEWASGSLTDLRRIGTGYVHDGNVGKGERALKWTLEVKVAGEYEILFYYPPNANRATNALLTIDSAGKITSVTVNQKTGPGVLSLGKFQLPTAKPTSVTLSNADSEGYVVADGLQLLKQ